MTTNRISDPVLLNGLCGYINVEARDMYLDQVFSTSKNEFVLTLRFKDTFFYLEAYMDDETSFVFFPSNVHAGRNSQFLFLELENLKFISAVSNRNDRSFFINFEKDYSILFKLYGRNANVLLFEKENVVSTFRSQFNKDIELKKPGFEPESLMIEGQKYFIYQSTKNIYLGFENSKDDMILSTSSTAEAVNFFAGKYLYARSFQTKKQNLLKNLLKKKERLEKGINSANASLEHLEKDKSYKIQADILMANLHAIPERSEKVELYDFYNDAPIIIKLKKDVSPQKWAESLYKKSRNQEVEKEKTLEKIVSLEKQLKDISFGLAKIESANTSSELRPFLKEESEKESKSQMPFRQMEILGYEVYVGKSAQSNDELLRHAGKEDIWLHARGVSGSHVIIRRKGKLLVPKDVIEKAAQIAAWNSKGKNATLCPVIYTPRKFVRKPKGAAPGAVLCDREEVVMVVPDKGF